MKSKQDNFITASVSGRPFGEGKIRRRCNGWNIVIKTFTGTLGQLSIDHPLPSSRCLHSRLHQCAPKTGQGPAARSPGNERRKQTSRREMRKLTLFSFYLDVYSGIHLLGLGRWVVRWHLLYRTNSSALPFEFSSYKLPNQPPRCVAGNTVASELAEGQSFPR